MTDLYFDFQEVPTEHGVSYTNDTVFDRYGVDGIVTSRLSAVTKKDKLTGVWGLNVELQISLILSEPKSPQFAVAYSYDPSEKLFEEMLDDAKDRIDRYVSNVTYSHSRKLKEEDKECQKSPTKEG